MMRAEHTWGSLLKSAGNEGSLFAQIPAKTCLTLMYFSSVLALNHESIYSSIVSGITLIVVLLLPQCLDAALLLK